MIRNEAVAPAAEWPKAGRVPPTFAGRAERGAKRLANALRSRRLRESARGASDIDLVFREVRSQHPRSHVPELVRAFNTAFDEETALETTFAALALMVVTRHKPRINGLVAFLELCYTSARLDAAAARFGERLLWDGPLPPDSPLAALEFGHGWPVLAAGVREFAASLGPLEQRRRPRRPAFDADFGVRRVVVRPNGGLGNQMFEYAAALAYAQRVGLPLRLDLFIYEQPNPFREFLLGRLRVPVRRANAVELLWTRRRPHFERRGRFDEFVFEDHGSAWLCGLWEDGAYFAGIAPIVRRQFAPRSPAVAAAAKDLVERARQGAGEVVGIHVRRGDRAPGGAAYFPFSTLPPEYYRRATGTFPPGTRFLVFSDTPEDIAWCTEHLGIEAGASVTFGDGRDPIVDMFALAACDHVILSAGTFSWWAAYLGDRPGRRVIAPNPLQAHSAGGVMDPPTLPPLPHWEVITLPVASGDEPA